MKKGFTLAEVLITLGIIGVVSAMTLPTLSASIQKHQAAAGLMKAINTLEQANKSLLHDNDARTINIACGVANGQGISDKVYLEHIAPYLNGSFTNTEAEYANYNYYKYYTPKMKNSFKTRDGMVFGGPNTATWYTSHGSIAYTPIYVDINGDTKGPNMLGKDLFELYINTTTNTIYANGSDALNNEIESATHHSMAYRFSWRDGCNANTVYTGEYCAGSIVDNGGKIIYLWK